MTISRRRLLAGVPLAAGLVALPGCGSRGVLDVRDFGAKGDGVTDDSQAIQSAAAALRSHGTLHFPPGRYRFAQHFPPGMAAVVVTGVTNAAVDFAPGAELLMDNVEPSDRTGTGHGILVRGPASRISLRNITIRWTQGSQRSLGDGIRVEGMPDLGTPRNWQSQAGPVTGVAVSDCVVENSPQTGVVMLGAANISVRNLRVSRSGADGLHFNACRHARVRDVHTTQTGDDGLALVTYYDREFSYHSVEATFAFPELTPWSNTDFEVRDVTVRAGRANGVRLAGAQQVRISGLDVTGVQTGSAVMVDSAEPGTDVGWHYVASRDIRIDDVATTGCHTGIHLLARPGESGDARFTEFGVHVGRAHLDGCDNWAVHAESLAAQPMRGLHIEQCVITSGSGSGGNGGLGLHRAHDVSLGEVSIRHAEPVVVFRAREAERLAVRRLAVTIDKPDHRQATPAPAVMLHGSGAIDDLELGWAGAPASWHPVAVTPAPQCGRHPVVIKQLRVHTPQGNSGIHCS
ncbi:glycosyl hydrolase family 28-related protein [Mycobacterium sp. SMC-4]|uniref:glycosyl hydrolase family 28-related protein n=1 Tax=Mycobacterium sp. SMC-4 TaxID=2857059 RepID=UPI0021B1AEFB|nr:glycosyl hydrolase family 28-related protein [Mycobacterium sp. SMC-4]UXA19296.1 right-handed parallel beta-helix repeat-containing protein [Mycobacterium sp. SMC-4]